MIRTFETLGLLIFFIFHSSAQTIEADKARVMDYFQNQEFNEAIDYLSPILQADSGNATILAWAGYSYFMTDRARESMACYRRLIAVDSNNISALHYLVLLESNVPGEGEALDYAMRLLQLQPQRAIWWRTVGECLRRQNKSDSAFRYFDSAYSLAPQDVRTVAGLAELLIEKSDYATADTLLDYALSTDSLNITLLRLRVRDAYLAQHFDQAIMPGERLVRLQDPSVTPLTWLALSYYNLKLYTDCIRICDFMLSIGFDLESVYYYEAQAYAKLKNYSRSNELLSKALGKAISVTAEWYYDAQADNYEALKSYKKALACCDTSFYLFKNPITLYNAGRICENKLRELAMAKSYYRRYLAMARPKSETEKKAYIYVRRRWGSKALR